MNTALVLRKEKIVSLSELQKNPIKALSSGIVRIIKNGKELGIYMSKEEFEDFLEELLPLREEFIQDLNASVKSGLTEPLTPLEL